MDKDTSLPLEKAQSVQNLDTSHKTGLRRNMSFEEKWLSNFGGHNSEMMDFVDDSDSWSQASYDSTCTQSTDGHVSSKPYRTLSLTNFHKRSTFKDLGKLSDSLKEVDKAGMSPQSTPGCAHRPVGGPSNSIEAGDLQNKRGLSHSMILNWLYFKKYPTITEGESGDKTPVVGSPVDAGVSLDAAMKMGPASSPEQLQEALRSVENAERKTMSFRDLNAVAPSCW